MGIFDLLKFAVKTVNNKWAIFSLVFIVIATSCLCFSHAAWTVVQKEKSLPYELFVSSEGAKSITPDIITKISNKLKVLLRF